MKPQPKNAHHGRTVLPKGDRMKWTPLREVAPVKLHGSVTQGQRLDSTVKATQQNNSGAINLLVP